MIYTDEKVFMNTIVRITVISSKGTVFTKEKIQKAFTHFSDVVKKFSRFAKDSDLSKFNSDQSLSKKTSPELSEEV